MTMESKAVAKYVRISPRKVRLIMDQIRGQKAGDAMNSLAYSSTKGARLVKKLVHSAVANAEENMNVDVDSLYIKKVYADEGPTLKRFRPRAMGRATKIRKRTSHLTVILDES